MTMERIFIKILFVAYLFNSLSFAQAVTPMPTFASSLLKQHSCWQTSSFMNLGQSKVLLVAKKWMIKGNDAIELTQTSLSNDGKWISAKLDLAEAPSIQDLTNFPFKGSFDFTQLKHERLLATVEVGFKLEVLFAPSSCADTSTEKYFGDIGVGETPFGLNPPPVPYNSILPPKYIHHKAGSKVVVRLNEGFPVQYIESVRSAISKWNVAIGWNVYTLVTQQDSLDSLECLATKSLCLFWQGPKENVGWIGWGGLTSLNFDPISGEILGAVIFLQNMSSGNLEPTPQTILKEISTNLSPDLVAQFLLRKEEFKKYAHPFPEKIWEHVLIHEIGHANGLKHDFKGSLTGDPSHPSETVMEYLPFIVSNRLNYLGSKDLSRINAVYRNTAPRIQLKTCSDAEAKEGKDPNCLQNDLGEPAAWYVRLSKLGDKGPFTIVRENQSGLPERPYIDLLGKFIANPLAKDSQERAVSEYLCQSGTKDESAKYLRETQNKELSCF